MPFWGLTIFGENLTSKWRIQARNQDCFKGKGGGGLEAKSKIIVQKILSLWRHVEQTYAFHTCHRRG